MSAAQSRPAEPSAVPSQADMIDAMVDLAKSAVRSAVAAGGDPAAGVLRLLLNDLSPMPVLVAPSDTRRSGASDARSASALSGSRPEGVADDDDVGLLAASAQSALRDMAKARRPGPGRKQLEAYADLLGRIAAHASQRANQRTTP